MSSIDEFGSPTALLSTADNLRHIFSLAEADIDLDNYKSIRLTCKRFKTVLDTLIVGTLLVQPEKHLQQIQYKLFGYYKFHADSANKHTFW